VAQIGPVYVPQNAQPPESIPAIPAAAVALVQPAYAGFWLRAIAFAIDTFILSFVFAIIASAYPTQLMIFPDPNKASILDFPRVTPAGFILMFVIVWGFYSFFEASAWQATPGKRILKIYVTDLNGQRISFGRALLRNLARQISGIAMIGYIIAGFTQKKQALHDILAGCLVLRRR
jgi:uncharacterized RDD family membrane protein YckC